MKITAIKTKIFKEGDNLVDFIVSNIHVLNEGDILVVTSKIVALSEKRVVSYVSDNDLVRIIKDESQFARKTKHVWLTIKDGLVIPSAGIDKSNARDRVILLPKDSFASAKYIRKCLMEYFKIKKLGVIISDSRTFPLRKGVVGIAVGYAGFLGLRNYVGKKDLFGRILKFSRTDVADSLATGAILLMGEADECQPLSIINDAPVVFTNRINKKELYIDPSDDMYKSLL